MLLSCEVKIIVINGMQRKQRLDNKNVTMDTLFVNFFISSWLSLTSMTLTKFAKIFCDFILFQCYFINTHFISNEHLQPIDIYTTYSLKAWKFDQAYTVCNFYWATHKKWTKFFKDSQYFHYTLRRREVLWEWSACITTHKSFWLDLKH